MRQAGLRVAIVDDEPLARARLRRLLAAAGEGRIDVVLECSTADEFLDQVVAHSLDTVFMDIAMPGRDGVTAVATWPEPRPHIVFVSAHPEHALRAFDVRATDYLTKPIIEARLLDTLARLEQARDATSKRGGENEKSELTARQVEILSLLADNRSNKEVARALGLSHFTVRNHLSALFRMFGVAGRADLLARVASTGALDERPSADPVSSEVSANSVSEPASPRG